MTSKVLIVDDEPNTVMSLEYWIGQAGYRVAVANSSDLALAKVEEFRPDVVLLDVLLPEANGFDVLQYIRQDPSSRYTVVIMLSAKGREKEVNKGLALGADGYITKPFSSHEVLAKVRDCLENLGDHNTVAI